jgi:hypothetical protein
MFLDVGQQSRRFTPAHALQLLMLTFCVIFSGECCCMGSACALVSAASLALLRLQLAANTLSFFHKHHLLLVFAWVQLSNHSQTCVSCFRMPFLRAMAP